MNNIVECRHCGKYFISEEFDGHSCKIAIKRTETIFYDKIIQTEEDGKDVFMMLSEDGTLYNIKPINRKFTAKKQLQTIQIH